MLMRLGKCGRHRMSWQDIIKYDKDIYGNCMSEVCILYNHGNLGWSIGGSVNVSVNSRPCTASWGNLLKVEFPPDIYRNIIIHHYWTTTTMGTTGQCKLQGPRTCRHWLVMWYDVARRPAFRKTFLQLVFFVMSTYEYSYSTAIYIATYTLMAAINLCWRRLYPLC